MGTRTYMNRWTRKKEVYRRNYPSKNVVSVEAAHAMKCELKEVPYGVTWPKLSNLLVKA